MNWCAADTTVDGPCRGENRGERRVIGWPAALRSRDQFLHSDDMDDARLRLLEHDAGPAQVNVGTGSDVTIASTIASVVGYSGAAVWDTSKPPETPQELSGVSLLPRRGGGAPFRWKRGYHAR